MIGKTKRYKDFKGTSCFLYLYLDALLIIEIKTTFIDLCINVFIRIILYMCFCIMYIKVKFWSNICRIIGRLGRRDERIIRSKELPYGMSD